jgi:hypothetical protein
MEPNDESGTDYSPLPPPTWSFTIPSIHDDIDLECRIYHPPQLEGPRLEGKWHKKGAIIAHPYAPLGGCYDDPVVHSAAAEVLKKGFVVGLFNFRCDAGTKPLRPEGEY